MALTHSLGAVQPQTEPEPRPLNADDDGATRMLKAMTRTTDYGLLTMDYWLRMVNPTQLLLFQPLVAGIEARMQPQSALQLQTSGFQGAHWLHAERDTPTGITISIRPVCFN